MDEAKERKELKRKIDEGVFELETRVSEMDQAMVNDW